MKAVQEFVEGVENAPGQLGGVIIGQLVAIDEQGRPLVVHPGQDGGQPVPALCTRELRREHVGSDVALMLESGGRPILLAPVVETVQEPPAPAKPEEVSVERDGERLTLTAEREIVLRCGKSSITLTNTGKVVIRGAHLLSRATGPNRIKGGSVELN